MSATLMTFVTKLAAGDSLTQQEHRICAAGHVARDAGDLVFLLEVEGMVRLEVESG